MAQSTLDKSLDARQMMETTCQRLVIVFLNLQNDLFTLIHRRPRRLHFWHTRRFFNRARTIERMWGVGISPRRRPWGSRGQAGDRRGRKDRVNVKGWHARCYVLDTRISNPREGRSNLHVVKGYHVGPGRPVVLFVLVCRNDTLCRSVAQSA